MSARISQLPVETLIQPTTQRARLTQLPLEVIYTLRVLGSVRISQLPIEVIMGNTPEPTRKKYWKIIQCI